MMIDGLFPSDFTVCCTIAHVIQIGVNMNGKEYIYSRFFKYIKTTPLLRPESSEPELHRVAT
jgi:hypothetical protein